MKHCRHYYVAVAAEDLKLVRSRLLKPVKHNSKLILQAFVTMLILRLSQSTLVDLISALQARGPCAFAIVCR
jgi:hypothetical protein